MSDFLTRLAAREIGGGNALRPRLPSLFESTAGAGAMPLEAEGRLERAAPPAPVAHRDEFDTGPAARASVPAPPPKPTTPARTAASPPAPPETKPPARIRTEREVVRSEVETRIERRESVAPESRVRPAAALPRAATVQPVRVRVAAEVEPPAPPRRVETGVADAAPATRGRADAPVRPPNAALAAPAPARRVPQAQAARPREETVVQVSIGRIEVRADAGARPSPAPRREGPRPTRLEDYLRQRGGRREP